MTDDTRPAPFAANYRASNLLLHVTSVPSPYGIVAVEPAACKWIDRLHEAGQSWWQALPLGPTGYGNSPHQSLSSFAGNGLLISPDWLIEDGLLRASDCTPPSFSGAPWHVPAGAPTAQSGQWVPGAGADFFNAVKNELGVLPFIAADLGMITPDVCALRDQFRVPGTHVLQFAFDGCSDNPYLPHNYVTNTVVYTGTHDNPTSGGWYEELPPDQRQNLWRYLKSPQREGDEVAWSLMRLAWSSVTALAIAPLQDLLNLGHEARMNVPGRAEGNWTWRCSEEMLAASAFNSLRDLTRSSNRLGALRPPLTSEVAEGAS
jgi:4-alpha-glucanotransferase